MYRYGAVNDAAFLTFFQHAVTGYLRDIRPLPIRSHLQQLVIYFRLAVCTFSAKVSTSTFAVQWSKSFTPLSKRKTHSTKQPRTERLHLQARLRTALCLHRQLQFTKMTHAHHEVHEGDVSSGGALKHHQNLLTRRFHEVEVASPHHKNNWNLLQNPRSLNLCELVRATSVITRTKKLLWPTVNVDFHASLEEGFTYLPEKGPDRQQSAPVEVVQYWI